MEKPRYENLKVRPGTVKLLRLLSFHMDMPIVDVVKALADRKIAQLNITHPTKS